MESNETNRELLDGLISSTVSDISAMEWGKEKEGAISSLNQLYRTAIEDDHNNWEYNDRAEKRASDEKAQNRDRLVKVGLELVGIASTAALFLKGLKFEETGSIASSMMRSFITKITRR